MKRRSIFILIMLLSITLSSCTKKEATDNEDYSEKEISIEEDLDISLEKLATNSKENVSGDLSGTNLGDIDSLIILLKAGQSDDKEYLYPEADENFHEKLVSWWEMNEDVEMLAVCEEISRTICEPEYSEKIFKNVLEYTHKQFIEYPSSDDAYNLAYEMIGKLIISYKSITNDSYNEYNLTIEGYNAAVLRTPKNEEDFIEVIQEISNKEDIAILDKAMNNKKWKVIKPGQELKEMAMIYLIINRNTMLKLYGGDNHAQIMEYTLNDGKFIKSKISEIFVLNDDAYTIVKEYVGEY